MYINGYQGMPLKSSISRILMLSRLSRSIKGYLCCQGYQGISGMSRISMNIYDINDQQYKGILGITRVSRNFSDFININGNQVHQGYQRYQ